MNYTQPKGCGIFMRGLNYCCRCGKDLLTKWDRYTCRKCGSTWCGNCVDSTKCRDGKEHDIIEPKRPLPPHAKAGGIRGADL